MRANDRFRLPLAGLKIGTRRKNEGTAIMRNGARGRKISSWNFAHRAEQKMHRIVGVAGRS
jgi:hypothetical protein